MKLKLVKCERNHYYDAERYQTCPHCNKQKMGESEKPQGQKTNAGTTSQSSPSHNTDGVKTPDGVQGKNKKGFLSSIFGGKQEEKTHSLWSNNKSGSDEHESSTTEEETSVALSAESEIEQCQLTKETAPSLEESIEKVALSGSFEDIKTISYYDFGEEIEPVVGWLVQVNAEQKGKSYNLKCGKNTIGRSSNKEVVNVNLEGDASVSRGAQAIVIFEPKKSEFLIQPSNGNTLVYLNNDLLMTYVKLNSYDRISLGKSELVFVPFCGKHFSWDNNEGEQQK